MEKKRNRLSATVVKAMGVLSGVQVVSILCSMVRVKLIALWVGAAGFGLFSLFNQVLDSIRTLTQSGLPTSTVRDVAKATSPSAISRIAYVVRRWYWLLGILGAFLTLAGAPLLSRITFGDSDHTLGFAILSLTLIFAALNSSEISILQGTGRIRQLAKASLWGAIGGLAISIPLFYFLRIDSIVPSILAYSISSYVAAWIFRPRLDKPVPRPTPSEVKREGLDFIKLGVYLTVTSFATLFVNYIFAVYLNRNAGLDTVGYYQAGYTLVEKYLGLLYIALGTEYFPRLSKVSFSKKRISLFLNHETTVILVAILPCAASMIAFDNLVVQMLYSSAYGESADYMSWALVGSALKAMSWCLGYVILAKGDGGIYLFTEITSAILAVTFNILGYEIGGLEGLGVSYIAWYLAYLAIVWTICKVKYRVSLAPRTIYYGISVTIILLACAVCRALDIYPVSWCIAAASIIFALISIKSLCKSLCPNIC